MKSLFLVFILTLVTSCGKDLGSSSSNTEVLYSPFTVSKQIETSDNVLIDLSQGIDYNPK